MAYTQEVQFSGTVVTLRWPDFKAMVTAKGLRMQFITRPDSYTVFALDDGLGYVCLLVLSDAAKDFPFARDYDQSQNAADLEEFETDWKPAANRPLDPRNSDGCVLQSQEPRLGTELILVTHNFCDPTTWYTQSVRETDENLTDSGDGLTWTSNHEGWIDMTHGKLFDEDALCADVDHGYAVSVTVDGVTMTQRDPYVDSGGDYDVDYVAGKVTFFQSQAGKTVVANYSRANGSEWHMIPADGMYLDIEGAEAQFSKDAILNDDIQFDIFGYNPNDLPNKVLYARSTYKKFVNYIDEAIGSYPMIAAIGGAGRGCPVEVYGFPFRYGTVRRLLSSHGIELRVRLKSNTAFGGTHATATFYCTVKPEGS